MRKALRSPIAYVLLAGVLLLLAVGLFRGGGHVDQLTLNGFTADISDGRVASATLHDGEFKVTGRLKGPDGTVGDSYQVGYPEGYTAALTQQLLDHGVPEVDGQAQQGVAVGRPCSSNYLPVVLLFGGFLFIIYAVQGGGSRVMQFGKAKPRTATKDQPKVTFADVAGADEAVAELQEIKDFLALAGQVPGHGGQDPQGGAALRAARDRQDAAGPGGGR